MYIKIGEIVIKSMLWARIKVRALPKVKCFEIAYFSYTKRSNYFVNLQ